MKNETGFYAMGAAGTEPGRVVAVARHIPDAVAYVYGRSNIRDLFGHHNVTTIVPRCRTPGCIGLSATDLADWVRDRDPARLVMDAQPYGFLASESYNYIAGRQRPTYYLHRRSTVEPQYNLSYFAAVLGTDGPAEGIEDLNPVLAFDSNELPTRSEARATLGGSDRPLVMVIGEGTTPNYTDFVNRHCRARGIDVVVVNTYPVMTLMTGADLIVGYCGYSQVEAAALGVPMAGIISHAERTQTWRANTTPTELAAQLAALDVRDAPERVSYTNHARRAAALISGYSDWETVDG